MGMSVGSTGGGSGGDPEPMMDINTTPLIDVMLVLIIMLIITIPIQLHAVNLNLPVGTPPPSDFKPEVINIAVDPQSTVFWQGVAIAGPAELETKMREAAAQPVQPEVHLRPDKDSRYSVVAGVLAETKRIGLTKIAVLGAEQFLE